MVDHAILPSQVQEPGLLGFVQFCPQTFKNFF